MQQISSSGLKRIKGSLASFTLVEVLTVIAIIAILAALTLAASEGIMNTASRARAKGEIQAMSTALESYKTDNGAYPVGNTPGSTASTLLGPPSGTYDINPSDPAYLTASEVLFQDLSGLTNFNTDIPVAGVKTYMSFKKNQIGTIADTYSYVQDPWQNSYGYSTGEPSSPPQTTDPAPYNGAGFFDLWSTGGATSTTANPTNSWISNWAQ